AYMADGYARLTGRIGVCEGPSGGGATYILPGLIEANDSSVAVLGITTDISVASYGKYPLTEVDQDRLMQPLTKWNAVIRTADHIPRMFRAAFRHMASGTPGSAHLGVPYDIQYDPVCPDDVWGDRTHAVFPSWRSAPAPGSCARVVDAILAAEQPLVVCGGGVIAANACAELETLASQLDIGVGTSLSGKGSLSDQHPLALGVVGSNGGTDATWEVLAGADLVVFLGCRAGSTVTSRWEAPSPSTRIIHIDSNPAVIGANYPVEIGVVADLKLALAELNMILMSKSSHPTMGGTGLVAAAHQRKFAEFDAIAARMETPIRPELLITIMQDILPDNAVLVSDPGTSCPYIAAYYRLPRAGRYFLTNRAHGALGYSLGAAMGAWYGQPERKIVAIMGDGSFGFACGELETVMRYEIPLLIIVLNNSSFGWIKASQHDECGARYHNVDFSRSNHAEIARAYGMPSWRVEAPHDLDPVLREAAGLDGPALVEVICQPLEETRAPVRRWMG
ncbi:MAG: thiamine pyrophosphate-binding protein, partial [Rhodobacteraceae bacterium]|nr:thiamine pyrophosphate-binding protein [Paracoccaceae bacterium]